MPRRASCWCPVSALFGLGCSRKDAKIAADLAEAAIATITDAEAVGRFEPLPEADLFDVEYWSLEQAKLGSAKELPLAGQVAVITGAGGAIGSATAKAFAAAGAEVALLDLDEAAAQATARAIGAAALGIRCDVTDAASVRDAFARWRPRSAAWISRCRMRVQPGRAGSAKSMRRCCGKASS